MSFLAKLRSGFTDVVGFTTNGWLELKKVRWPNRKELTSYTAVVLATVVFITVYFSVLDFGITQIIDLVLGQ